MSDIDLSLLPDFIVEAEEHLQEMEAFLLDLGSVSQDVTVANEIFRVIHSIKGGAQYIGCRRISELAHRFEDLLDLFREGSIPYSHAMLDTLIAGRDRIGKLVDELKTDQEEHSDVADLVEQISAMIETGGETQADGEPESAASAAAMADEAAAGVAESEAEPAAANGILVDFGEESDPELLTIFREHLRDNLRKLATLLNALSSAPTLGVIDDCLDVLRQLRSSSNYMDYREFVNLYEAWIAELSQAREDYSADAGVDWGFMNRYVARIEGFLDGEGLAAAAVPDGSPWAETGSGEAGEGEYGEDISDAVRDIFGMDADAGDESDTASEPPVEPVAEPVAEPDADSPIDFSLLPDFIVEGSEHLRQLENLLVEIGMGRKLQTNVDHAFRVIHTLKGGAEYVGLSKIPRVAQLCEDLLDALRGGGMTSNPDIVEVLIQSRDAMLRLLHELETGKSEQSSVAMVEANLQRVLAGEALESTTDVPPVESATAVAPESSAPATVSGFDVGNDVENDSELFGIFLEHALENLGALRARMEILGSKPEPSADTQAELLAGEKAVQSLKFAANYMGYDDLVAFYDEWLKSIGASIRDFAAGGSGSLAPIFEFLDAAQAKFSAGVEAGGVAAGSVADEPSKADSIPAAPPALARLPEPESMPDAMPDAIPAAPIIGGGEASRLMDTLSAALDSSVLQTSRSEYETLNQVFDEMLSGSVPDRRPDAGGASGGRSVAGATASQPEVEKAKKKSLIKKSVRVDAEKIDILMNQVGELVVDRSYFHQLFDEMRDLQSYLAENANLDQKDVKRVRTFVYRLGEAIAGLGRTSNDLQEGVMKMRMLPISQIFSRYPRLVHDLTHKTDKRVNLVIHGEDTELDKMLVEEISDPLIHIIRNAVDHGLESMEERRLANKAETGTLTLEAYQESNHIVIEVTDDGRGLDTDKIKRKAIEKGLYNADELERMSREDIIKIVTKAGFSTADKISGTSGRGVGMDVVRKNIEKLNGTLEIDSIPGKRTQIRLRIPLTLAIIHALMVKVGGEFYTIPLANIEETVRIYQIETSIIEDTEVIHLRGQTLPIFRLTKLFGMQAAEENDKAFVVIVNASGQRLGFVVDELHGQQEVVIKPLTEYVQDKTGFSGATIIGDGRISLILDIYELAKMVTNKQIYHHQKQAQQRKEQYRQAKKARSTAFEETASK